MGAAKAGEIGERRHVERIAEIEPNKRSDSWSRVSPPARPKDDAEHSRLPIFRRL
jgi:hypothetical protein